MSLRTLLAFIVWLWHKAKPPPPPVRRLARIVITERFTGNPIMSTVIPTYNSGTFGLRYFDQFNSPMPPPAAEGAVTAELASPPAGATAVVSADNRKLIVTGGGVGNPGTSTVTVRAGALSDDAEIEFQDPQLARVEINEDDVAFT